MRMLRLCRALFGPCAMSDLSPECAPKRTFAKLSEFLGSRPGSKSFTTVPGHSAGNADQLAAMPLTRSARYGELHATASNLQCRSAPESSTGTRHDRSLLLDHAERPQDHDVSRRGRAEIQDFPDQYRQGRPVQAGVSGGRPEQPHSRDGRPRTEGRRQADLDLRIRRDAFVSRGEDREIPALRHLRPLRRDPVDVLANGRARPDGGTEP